MRELVDSRYGRIWRTAVGLLAVIGLAAALVFVSPKGNLVGFLIAFFVAGMVDLSVGIALEVPGTQLVRSAPAWATLAGLVVLSICGYAAAVGLATLLLLGVIVATSPVAVRQLWPVGGAAVTKPPTGPRAEAAPDPLLPVVHDVAAVARNLRDLTDDELCLAWRRSFVQLQNIPSAGQRIAMADVRRAYLDELERRQPAAFAAWIESGPRAAGDPAKFFTPHTGS